MPRLVSTGNIPVTGTQSVNYYNEPIAARLGSGTLPTGDLSYAFDNQAAKANNLNQNPEPQTPLMRAYQNDNVQIRVLVGAHVFAHQFNLMGPRWQAEPSWDNSGYRSNQPMGLSEHFELLFKVPSSSAPLATGGTVRQCPDKTTAGNCVDYLYSPSWDETGIAQGLWGLFRSYDPTGPVQGLSVLPNNPVSSTTNVTYATCPAGAPQRTFNITAVTSQKALPNGALLFNNRGPQAGWMSTLMGIMYVRNEDLDGTGKLKTGVPIEPLILRANAGDCINVNLKNSIDPSSIVLEHNFNWPSPFKPPIQQKMSKFVGLHPQLHSYDAASSFGMNVGWNSVQRADQFANFNETVKYQWYAGTIERGTNGALTYTPVEFGALNLFPSDPLFQHPNGMFGQMIIEPQSATYTCGAPGATSSCEPGGGATTRAQATVKVGSAQFREFSVMISDALQTSLGNQGTAGINYTSEPRVLRYNPDATDFSCMTSNLLDQPPLTSSPIGEPKTPIFLANQGDEVRFRMTHPMGTGDSLVFTVHGHAWQRNPYQKNSLIIGNNNLSQWLGSRDNHGSSDHFDLVIPRAGGDNKKVGDYLYSAYLAEQAALGVWGLFRVQCRPGDAGCTAPPPPAANAMCKAPSTPTAAPRAVPPDKANPLVDRFRRKPLNPGGNP
jgi:hypothetical protein